MKEVFTVGRSCLSVNLYFSRKYFWNVCRYLELAIVKGDTESAYISIDVFPRQCYLLKKHS